MAKYTRKKKVLKGKAPKVRKKAPQAPLGTGMAQRARKKLAGRGRRLAQAIRRAGG